MRILEQQDWDRAPEIVSDAGMVIVSVPIHVTEQVIAKLPRLPSDCILVDLASVKNGPLRRCWLHMMARGGVTPNVWSGQRQSGQAGRRLV